MARTRNGMVTLLLGAVAVISACSTSPGFTGLPPILSPYIGFTVDGFGGIATCSALGGPVDVSAMMDGWVFVRVSSSSGVSEGAVFTNNMYPPRFTSHAIAPGECFTVTIEITDPAWPGQAQYAVRW